MVDIVAEIRADRERGFRRLEREYKARLTAVAREVCADPTEAEALVFRTLGDAVRQIESLEHPAALFAWMRSILLHQHEKSVRRKSNSRVVYTDDLPENVPEDDGAGRVIRAVDGALLREAVDSLPPKLKEAVVLRYFMDMPIRQIARFLTLPVGTIHSRLHLARTALAVRLGGKLRRPAVALAAAALLLAAGAAVVAAAGAAVVAAAGRASGVRPPAAPPPLESEQQEEQDMKNITRLAAGAAVAGLAAAPLEATTYTWLDNAANTTWDTTSPNWRDGTTAGVAWTDGNDAAFNNTAAYLQVFPSGDRRARNITKTGAANLLLTENDATGSFGWTGWFSCGANVYFRTPLSDDGNGLRFDVVGGICRLQRHNRHTGGTYIRNSAADGAVRAFLIDGVETGSGDGSDLALGAVPETARTNVWIEGGTVALHAGNALTIHANRTFLIRDGQTFYVSPSAEMHIAGRIVGEYAGATAYPTATTLCAAPNWTGRTILSGDGNYFGRLKVGSNLEIRAGDTHLVTTGPGVNGNATLWVYGDSVAYSTAKGYLLVSGGLLWNSQSGYRFQTSHCGHLDIAGGTVQMAYGGGASGEFLNGYGSPGKVTLRDGGLLRCGRFRLSQTADGDGGELCLLPGGTLRARTIGLDFGNVSKGVVHFNGGALQSLDGNAGTSLTEQPANANWNGCVFKVEAGGAVFDTAGYGMDVWFGRPLLTGAAAGAADGGLTCRLGGGRRVVLHDAVTGSTYTGPTRLVAGGDGAGDRTLQCRVANALPAATTLQIGPGTAAAFADGDGADLAQTVARAEGAGALLSNAHLTVTGAVSPVFDGAYGTLTFEKPCDLACDYEIVGDAAGCGRLRFASAGQDIGKLTLKCADIAALNAKANSTFYKILDAPNGYTGEFALAADWVKAWMVKYTATAAYIYHPNGTLLTLK